MSTARAVLTGIRGIHCHNCATGACCLVRKEASELTPRHIMNTLGETVIMRHPLDRQLFNDDEIKHVHDATTVLMGEVAASPGNTFMHPRDHLAAAGIFRRPFL